MSHRLLVALAALFTTAIFEMVSAAPFPVYDDGGVVNWKLSYAQAQSLAQKAGKPIFIAAGKDKDGDSEKLVQTTLRDERIGQFLNRHFVPVGVDFPYAEAQLRPILLRAGKTPPVIVILNDQGQYLVGLSGYKKPNEVETELIKVLENKANAVPKGKEAELTKQVEMLEKALADKAWAKATPVFRTIIGVKGYHSLKDKAYDLMDMAQSDGNQALKDAYNHTRQDEYAEAKKSLEKVIKDYAGAPVADRAKDHLAAVGIMENVHKITGDPKVNRKGEAARLLDTVLNKHSDSPYAALAISQKKELQKPAK
jgi:hypothetical protein